MTNKIKNILLIIITAISVVFIVMYFYEVNKKIDYETKIKQDKIEYRDSLRLKVKLYLQRKIDSLDSVPSIIIRRPYKVIEYRSRSVMENIKILSE